MAPVPKNQPRQRVSSLSCDARKQGAKQPQNSHETYNPLTHALLHMELLQHLRFIAMNDKTQTRTNPPYAPGRHKSSHKTCA